VKRGARVMFVKNNPDEGYMNGSIGHVVTGFDEGMPVVELLDGTAIVCKTSIVVDRGKWENQRSDRADTTSPRMGYHGAQIAGDDARYGSDESPRCLRPRAGLCRPLASAFARRSDSSLIQFYVPRSRSTRSRI
jgi:hypothetical protein